MSQLAIVVRRGVVYEYCGVWSMMLNDDCLFVLVCSFMDVTLHLLRASILKGRGFWIHFDFDSAQSRFEASIVQYGMTILQRI